MGAERDGKKGFVSGSVYIFKPEETIWTQHANLSAYDGATQDLFGNSVASSGGYAIVGAWQANSGMGAAYVIVPDEADLLGCSLIDSALTIEIPCLEYMGICHDIGIVLEHYSNPLDPQALYWKLNSVN